MRIAFAIPLTLVCGLALPAQAQSAQPSADSHAQTVSTAATKPDAAPPEAQKRSQEQEDQAAAALAMSIRRHEIEEQRIARIACAAGDASKCQAANAPTTASTPAP